VGRGRADYEETAELIEALLDRLVGMAWPRSAITEEQAS
jgi:hypothetical protein